MQVKLKVVGGKHDGREIKLPASEFLIGRGEEAHLRPNSDLISRKHCSIKVDDGEVVVRDLGSRNGTYVNGEKLNGPKTVSTGDRLRIGKLQFEFIVDVAQPSAKKPKVENVAEAVSRARTTSQADDDDLSEESITDWLTDPSGDAGQSKSMAETQQFRFDDTPTKMFTKSDERAKSKKQEESDEDSQEDLADSKSGSWFRTKKSKPKKLPQKPKNVADSTKSAADDVLRKFFNRR